MTVTRTEDLQAQAGMFKRNATTLKKQMCWKQLRVRAWLSYPYPAPMPGVFLAMPCV